MISIAKDTKANVPMWIITTTDKEGFHRQLNVSDDDMKKLVDDYQSMKG